MIIAPRKSMSQRTFLDRSQFTITCKQTAFLTIIHCSNVFGLVWSFMQHWILNNTYVLNNRCHSVKFEAQHRNSMLIKCIYSKIELLSSDKDKNFVLLESLVSNTMTTKLLKWNTFVKRRKCDRQWHSLFSETNHR